MILAEVVAKTQPPGLWQGGRAPAGRRRPGRRARPVSRSSRADRSFRSRRRRLTHRLVPAAASDKTGIATAADTAALVVAPLPRQHRSRARRITREVPRFHSGTTDAVLVNACARALSGSAAVLLLPPRRTGPGLEYSRSQLLPRPAWQPPVVALPGQPLCSHLRRQRLHRTGRSSCCAARSRRTPSRLRLDTAVRHEDRDPVLAQLPAISA